MMQGHIFVLFGMLLLVANSNGTRTRQRRLPLPRRVFVLHREPTEVTVNWEQPRGTYYERFTVSVKPQSATVKEPLEPGQTFRNIQGLKPGSSYVVGIRGITANGRQSATKRYRIWSEPIPPTNIKLDVIESLEIGFTFGNRMTTFSLQTVGIQVSWEESPSATSMSGYNVEVTPPGGLQAHQQPLEGQEDQETTRMFIGLIPGEEYTFTVRTQVGPPHNLVYSSPLSHTTRISPLKPFEVVKDTIGSTHAIIKTIGPLHGIHQTLMLELRPKHGEISHGLPDPYDFTHTLYKIDDLSPNTQYALDVYSVSHGVRSTEPVTITFTTASEPPVDLQVIRFTGESVTLQWDHPLTLLNEESVEYIIEYQDVMGLYDLESERVTVDNLDTRIHVKIQKLEPGATYSFMIFTEINGSRSEGAETIQTTIPPKPEVVTMNSAQEGVSIKVMPPSFGQCPQLIASYSPPLPGDQVVEPKTYHINENVTFPRLPQEEKYTIHLRCVSNNVEGHPLVISSKAQRNPESNSYEDDPNAPREPLLCSSSKNPSKPAPVDYIAPDACCGSKPYHTVNQMCCGSTIRRISDDDSISNYLCCIDQFYSPIKQVCCEEGIVNLRSVGCDRSR